MTMFSSIILGIVEGITEFLPISSTAHLEITSRLLKLTESDFLKTFEIVIQFGAILAVVFLYFSALKKNWKIWKKIIVAFIPTGAIGFVLYKIIKDTFLGNISIIVWTMGIGGIILIAFEYYYRNERSSEESMREIGDMSYSKAVAIGLAQSVAVIPGISRSAATIIAGRMLGLSKKAIIEFSFLLAIPTMLAAAGYDLLKSAPHFSSSEFAYLGIGLITSFIFALIAVKALLRFVEHRGFTWFGLYRIVLAIVLAIMFW